jgi:hypothetical protein
MPKPLDDFAIAAMTAILDNLTSNVVTIALMEAEKDGLDMHNAVARLAYKIAHAMQAESAKASEPLPGHTPDVGGEGGA